MVWSNTKKYNIILPAISCELARKQKALGEDVFLVIKPTQNLAIALAKVAKYFQREGGYDFCTLFNYGLMYLNPHRERIVFFSEFFQDEDSKDFTFKYMIYGVARFIRDEDFWSLDWVWLHPYKRNKGILSQAWSSLQKEFGDFTVIQPNSAVRRVIQKHRQTVQLTYGKENQGQMEQRQ